MVELAEFLYIWLYGIVRSKAASMGIQRRDAKTYVVPFSMFEQDSYFRIVANNARVKAPDNFTQLTRAATQDPYIRDSIERLRGVAKNLKTGEAKEFGYNKTSPKIDYPDLYVGGDYITGEALYAKAALDSAAAVSREGGAIPKSFALGSFRVGAYFRGTMIRRTNQAHEELELTATHLGLRLVDSFDFEDDKAINKVLSQPLGYWSERGIDVTGEYLSNKDFTRFRDHVMRPFNENAQFFGYIAPLMCTDFKIYSDLAGHDEELPNPIIGHVPL
jgi:hypothetical protein